MLNEQMILWGESDPKVPILAPWPNSAGSRSTFRNFIHSQPDFLFALPKALVPFGKLISYHAPSRMSETRARGWRGVSGQNGSSQQLKGSDNPCLLAVEKLFRRTT